MNAEANTFGRQGRMDPSIWIAGLALLAGSLYFFAAAACEKSQAISREGYSGTETNTCVNDQPNGKSVLIETSETGQGGAIDDTGLKRLLASLFVYSGIARDSTPGSSPSDSTRPTRLEPQR